MMFRKHVLRNRSLQDWAQGATLLSANGCDIAAGVLVAVAQGLSIFS